MLCVFVKYSTKVKFCNTILTKVQVAIIMHSLQENVFPGRKIKMSITLILMLLLSEASKSGSPVCIRSQCKRLAKRYVHMANRRGWW